MPHASLGKLASVTLKKQNTIDLSHYVSNTCVSVVSGILAQGVGCVLAGLWGTGSGTAIYADNIAIVGMTNVSQRCRKNNYKSSYNPKNTMNGTHFVSYIIYTIQKLIYTIVSRMVRNILQYCITILCTIE